MLGRDIQLPVDLMLGNRIPETQSVVSGVAYVKELRENLHRIHDIAREKLLKSSDRQKKAYDFRKNFKSYALEDTVYLHSSARKQGTSSKFHLPWTGPFLVVGKVSDLVYQIQRLSKSDLKYVHHDRLKLANVRLDNWLQGMNDKFLGSTLDQGNKNVNSESHGFNSSADDKENILIFFQVLKKYQVTSMFLIHPLVKHWTILFICRITAFD